MSNEEHNVNGHVFSLCSFFTLPRWKTVFSLDRERDALFAEHYLQSTAVAEFFTPWFVPYEHFIPVRPDLADLLLFV